ncbi:MAG: hypothetical protein M0P91_00905 [Sulfuricurvum sp.]|jgi:hypothetical protein|uniref:hypothetical protein n=1 Tax=Sulfuricurvum sp. TaxID=2025608 RepID=UPI0025D625D8|nr:hypothetical protein [Sulfuricurvum sp.]MCK9371728.1 hypothetical protein [Sulfuricurvum sp.]
MESIRLVPAIFEISFDRITERGGNFEREYELLSEYDEDVLGQLLRMANVRGGISESDPIVLHLLAELYRKMDRLEHLLTNTAPHREPLAYKGDVEGIGFEYFKLSAPMLIAKEHYYCRLELPVHPTRETPLFFEAVDETIGKILRIHPRDENAWSGYMTARERAMIRHLKGRE